MLFRVIAVGLTAVTAPFCRSSVVKLPLLVATTRVPCRAAIRPPPGPPGRRAVEPVVVPAVEPVPVVLEPWVAASATPPLAATPRAAAATTSARRDGRLRGAEPGWSAVANMWVLSVLMIGSSRLARPVAAVKRESGRGD